MHGIEHQDSEKQKRGEVQQRAHSGLNNRKECRIPAVTQGHADEQSATNNQLVNPIGGGDRSAVYTRIAASNCASLPHWEATSCQQCAMRTLSPLERHALHQWHASALPPCLIASFRRPTVSWFLHLLQSRDTCSIALETYFHIVCKTRARSYGILSKPIIIILFTNSLCRPFLNRSITLSQSEPNCE